MGHLLCGSKVAPPGTCTRKECAGVPAPPQEARLVIVHRSKRERWKGNACSFVVIPRNLPASDKHVHLSTSAE